jgi:hypothetical protein
MNYIGCALFGLFFLLMTAQTDGSSLHARMTQTLSWIHDWSPFSYLIMLVMLVAVAVSIGIMSVRPELEEESEDLIIEYRHEASGMEDSPIAAEECVQAGVSGISQVTD